MYKMKYSCYQESSVIHGWFLYWVFGWEMHRLSKSGYPISDGIVFVFHLAQCVRGFKSLKQLCPSLIYFRNWISNGKPELLLYLMFVFVISNFMKSSTVYAQVFARLLRFESMIWSSIRFDISLQNFKRPSDIFSHGK